MNKCFKSHSRLSRYLYTGNETGLIHRNLLANRTIEKSCFEKCWRENCEIDQYFPTIGKKTKTTVLQAEPKLSVLEFWIQCIGLICSFANISLNQLTWMAINFASLKVKRRKVRIGLLCLKWAILFLTLGYCGYQYTTMVLDHQAKEINPTRKEIARSHIKQKVLRLAICVDIKEYLTHDLILNLNDLNKTMSEIEKATDGSLDNVLEGIYLKHQNRKFRVDYIREPKVLFRRVFGLLHRCFSLLIRPDYQLMPSNPKLTIKFKVEYYSLHLYVLTENENLNEKTFEYTYERSFFKKVVKRLKLNGRCVNRERHPNCTSSLHCAERCTNREAFEKFGNITIEKAVVDKDQFSTDEWNTTHLKFPDRNLYPSHSTYVNISSRCFKKFQNERPCEEVQFNEKAIITQTDWKTLEIDLFLDVELSIEEFSWFNLLLNLMSTHTTFFSMNVLKLLRIFYSFIKPKLRMKLRNDKIPQFLICLLCSIGFTWHTYRIFDLSINEELTYSPNYEMIKKFRCLNWFSVSQLIRNWLIRTTG